MGALPLEQPQGQDIYSFGFDRYLNRVLPALESPIVYETVEESIEMAQIKGGGEITPNVLSFVVNTNPALASDQNDYIIGTGTVFRLTGASAGRTITGIAGGVAGRSLILMNVSGTIVLANQNTSSIAANRIITGTGANLTMAEDDSVFMLYDGISTRWRIISS